jgi:hypothetical protein
MNGYAIPIINELSAGVCPVIAWYSFPMSSMMGIIGPEHLGGAGDLAAKIELAVNETASANPNKLARCLFGLWQLVTTLFWLLEGRESSRKAL